MRPTALKSWFLIFCTIGLIGYVVGAGLAGWRTKGPKRSCSNPPALTEPPQPHLSVPGRELVSQTSEPLRASDLERALVRLEPMHGRALATWKDLPPSVTMRDLLFARRPRVTRNASGGIQSMLMMNDRCLFDESTLELLKAPVKVSEEAAALNAIDSEIEKFLGGAQEAAGTLLGLLQVGRFGGAALADGFGCAVRARAILALRDLKLDSPTEDRVRSLMLEDPDPILRGACAAALAANQRFHVVREWLDWEKNERALHAAVIDWQRYHTYESRQAATPFSANLAVVPGLGEILGRLSLDNSLHSDVRAAAVRALGYRPEEPGAYSTISTLISAGHEESIRSAAVLALGQCVGIEGVGPYLESIAFDVGTPEGVRASALVALARFPTRDRARKLAMVILEGTGTLRQSAAFALFGERHLLDDETKLRLRRLIPVENDPAVLDALRSLVGSNQ